MKNYVKYMSVLILMFFLLGLAEINADEITRKCKYVNNNEIIYLEYSIKDNKSSGGNNMKILDEDNKEIGIYSWNISSNQNNGCPQNLYQFYAGEKSSKIEWNHNDEYVKSKPMINSYAYVSVENNSDYDIYNSKLNETNFEIFKPEEISSERSIKCEYFQGSKTVILSVNNRGDIDISTYRDQTTSGTNIKNRASIESFLQSSGKCPVAVCFDTVGIGKDIAYFYLQNQDISSNEHNCDSTVINKRYLIKNTKSEINLYSEEEIEVKKISDKLANDVSKTLESYLQCMSKIDTSKKCEGKKNVYLTSVSEGNISAANGALGDYEKCFDESGINKTACNAEYNAYNEALNKAMDHQKKTGDRLLLKYLYKFTSPGKIDVVDLDDMLGEVDCEAILDAEVREWIHNIFIMIQIFAVVVTIILSMVDFTKAVGSSNEEAMKNAFKHLQTRLIVVVLIILIPAFIELILNNFEITGLNNNNPLCK